MVIPREITLRQQNEATHLIEEFMLAANETVAKEYDEKIPFMYRVHPEPDEERVRDLGMLRQLGRPLAGGGEWPLRSGRGEETPGWSAGEEKSMVSQMILRSMKQARYSRPPGRRTFWTGRTVLLSFHVAHSAVS